jgi:hypothetical protein
MARNKVPAAKFAELVARGLVAAPAVPPPGPAGRWVLTIPNFHPTPLNDLIGTHRMKAHPLKAADARRLGDEAELARVPRAAGRRRVWLRIILAKGQKGCDGDAYWKSCLDALVLCGRLRNDSRQWCEIGGPVEFERGKRATQIVLEDLP